MLFSYNNSRTRVVSWQKHFQRDSYFPIFLLLLTMSEITDINAAGSVKMGKNIYVNRSAQKRQTYRCMHMYPFNSEQNVCNSPSVTLDFCKSMS